MEYKKARWEKEYEKFLGKNSEELTRKIANINRELSLLKEGKEYGEKKNELAEAKKELAEFNKIDKNRDKIENILDFKKGLVEKTAELLKKKQEIEEIQKYDYDKEVNELDKEMEKIKSELREVEAKLKDKDLKPEDREALETEKQKILENYMKNQAEYKQASNKKQEFESKVEDMKNFDKTKIDQELLRNEKLMAKCDLIGANLVKGKSMDEISASLQKFSFTPNKDFAKKIKAMRELNNKEKEKTEEAKEPEVKEVDEIEAGKGTVVEVEKDEEEKNKLPEKVSRWSEFLQKHPRISKIINVIKNTFKREDIEEMKEDMEVVKEDISKEDVTKEDKKEKTSDFDYVMKKLEKDEDEVLKAVAEKGASGFRESIKVENKKKLEERQAYAAIGEARIYGGKYLNQAGINQKDKADSGMEK